MDTVVLDVDGTLVDSNYHHAIAWARAFEAHGLTVPMWRIHRHLGMGGDRLVAATAGEEAEHTSGDALRDRWKVEYDALIDQTRLLAGARELLATLKKRGLEVALASSRNPEHAQYAFDLLGKSSIDAVTTAEDAEKSKPDPELLREALDRVSGNRACLVGDSVWDIEAAQRAGLPAIAVLTGGYGAEELRTAGAQQIYDDLEDLLDHLDEALELADG